MFGRWNRYAKSVNKDYLDKASETRIFNHRSSKHCRIEQKRERGGWRWLRSEISFLGSRFHWITFRWWTRDFRCLLLWEQNYSSLTHWWYLFVHWDWKVQLFLHFQYRLLHESIPFEMFDVNQMEHLKEFQQRQSFFLSMFEKEHGNDFR